MGNVKYDFGMPIIGDLKGSMTLAERVRAFTHYFAFNLVTRNTEKLEALFSSKIHDSQSAEAIYARIAKLERKDGVPFGHFDHVRSSLFTTANMATPKSVSK